MIVDGHDVAAFLGAPEDTALVNLANRSLDVIAGLARAYTRDNGFMGDDIVVKPDLRSVLITATARLMANPDQVDQTHIVGPFTDKIGAGFSGWSLAELAVLNRYRKRAS